MLESGRMSVNIAWARRGLMIGSCSRAIAGRWLICLLALLLAGCGRGSKDLPDVSMVLTIEPDPPPIGVATISVTLKDKGGQLISGAVLELEGNMSHAGMAPVFGQAVEISPGVYQGDLEFTMAGDWFILVRADLPDGRSMERQVDVPGVDVLCGDTPAP